MKLENIFEKIVNIPYKSYRVKASVVPTHCVDQKNGAIKEDTIGYSIDATYTIASCGARTSVVKIVNFKKGWNLWFMT